MRSAFAFVTFGCSHNSRAGELPRSASSHFLYLVFFELCIFEIGSMLALTPADFTALCLEVPYIFVFCIFLLLHILYF